MSETRSPVIGSYELAQRAFADKKSKERQGIRSRVIAPVPDLGDDAVRG